MKRKKLCCECGKSLTRDESALSRKLLGMDTDEVYCLRCLAEYLDCTESDLEMKIREFKEQGCIFFL